MFDQKIDFKLGFTPNKKHEYVVGFQQQHGKKANPIYCVTETLNPFFSKAKYWQWSNWDKQTIYFLSKTTVANKNYLKTRLFYDNFYNLLRTFDDDTYSTQNKPSSFNSYYNDNSLVMAIEFNSWTLKNNKLNFSVQFKQDKHSEYNEKEPMRSFVDNTYTLAIEDVWNISEKIFLIPGFSVSRKDNLLAQDYKKNTNKIVDFESKKMYYAYNYQYQINSLSFSMSHKTRFATLKDRYSYRAGKSLANPFLKPEKSNNFDLIYSFELSKFNVKTSAFYSYLTDVIILVDNAVENKSQTQNFGKAQFYSFDLDINYQITQNIIIEANYSFIERKNLSNLTVLFTDVPKHNVYTALEYNFYKNLTFFANFQYSSDRYSTSYGTIAKTFWLINSRINFNFAKYFSINAEINNIFDIDYQLVEGYPMQGRNFFANIRVKLQKNLLNKDECQLDKISSIA